MYHPEDPPHPDLCPARVDGQHDWSEETRYEGRTYSDRYVVCVACGVEYHDASTWWGDEN